MWFSFHLFCFLLLASGELRWGFAQLELVADLLNLGSLFFQTRAERLYLFLLPDHHILLEEG